MADPVQTVTVTEIEHRTRLLRLLARISPRAEKVLLQAIREAKADKAALLSALERSATPELALDLVLAAVGLGTIAAFLADPVRGYMRPLRQAWSATAPVSASLLELDTGARLTAEAIRARGLAWSTVTTSRLIVGITESVRDAIRVILMESWASGLTVRQVAARIRPIVGLHPAWANAVTRYLDDLIAQGVPLRRAEALARKYSRRLLKTRSRNIGRTEILGAGRQADRATTAEAVKRGLIRADEWEQEWVGILRDGRICSVCYGLHGSRAPIGGLFPNGKAVPEGHPLNCRCQKRIVRKGAKEGPKPPFVEPKYGPLRPEVPAGLTG